MFGRISQKTAHPSLTLSFSSIFLWSEWFYCWRGTGGWRWSLGKGGGPNLRVTELHINRNGVFRGRVILRRHSRVSLFRGSL